MYLKRVKEVKACSCKYSQARELQQLRDQVQLCTELLHGICRPPLESKHLVGKFYISQVIEDVRHKHQMRQ